MPKKAQKKTSGWQPIVVQPESTTPPVVRTVEFGTATGPATSNEKPAARSATTKED